MIVVGASVLADALLDDGPIGQRSRAELSDDPHWAAPAHGLIEVCAVIRSKALGGKVSSSRAAEAVEALRELTIDEIDAGRLVDRMWQLRGAVTAFDAGYIATAELFNCPLVTGDRNLAKVRGIRCEIRVIRG